MKSLTIFLLSLFLFSLVFAQPSSTTETHFFIEPEAQDANIQDLDNGGITSFSFIKIILLVVLIVLIIYFLVKSKNKKKKEVKKKEVKKKTRKKKITKKK